MKKSLIAVALFGAFAAPAMAAEEAKVESAHTVTGNVGIVSNYIFRGISQTQHKPALQGGFDYSHASGFYLGTWGSNVNWVRDTGFKTENSLELDFYGGFKKSIGDFSFDVGALQYYYPGDRIENTNNTNSTEVYAGLGWKFLTLKYNYTVSPYLFGWQGVNGETTRGSGYLDLSMNYDIGSGWGVNAHVGRQWIHNYSHASYTDWKLGVTKDVGFGVVGLSYTDSNARACSDERLPYCWNGKDVGKTMGVLSFTKSF